MTEGDVAGVVAARPDGRFEAAGADDARPTDDVPGRDAGDVDGTPSRPALDLFVTDPEALGDETRGAGRWGAVVVCVGIWGVVVICVGAMERVVERDDDLGAADDEVWADGDGEVLDALVALTPPTVGAAWEPPRPQPVSAAMPAVPRITTAVRRIRDALCGASFGVSTVNLLRGSSDSCRRDARGAWSCFQYRAAAARNEPPPSE